jgi:hypothetical protein
VSPIVGARALYGLAVPISMAILAKGRAGRRPGAAHSEGGSPASTAAVAVTPPRLARRNLRALAVEGTDLRGYDLRRVRLNGLDLAGVELAGADLSGASFRKSNLVGADLRNTVLDRADFSGCDLRGAALAGASLLETDFGGADLRGTNLSACRQKAMVNLRGAHFDRHTQWPGGIDPTEGGAIRER